jgi:hypothetical protein
LKLVWLQDLWQEGSIGSKGVRLTTDRSGRGIHKIPDFW